MSSIMSTSINTVIVGVPFQIVAVLHAESVGVDEENVDVLCGAIV
jgi:hypothetical protein